MGLQMASYLITISPDDGSGATTTLRLETGRSGTVVTDLHLQDSAGLSQGRLPAIDYAMLLEAVNPSSPTPVRAASGSGSGRGGGGGGGERKRTRRAAPAATPATRKATTKSRTGTDGRA